MTETEIEQNFLETLEDVKMALEGQTKSDIFCISLMLLTESIKQSDAPVKISFSTIDYLLDLIGSQFNDS